MLFFDLDINMLFLVGKVLIFFCLIVIFDYRMVDYKNF